MKVYTAIDKINYEWCRAEIILTGESQVRLRKSCPRANYCTTVFTRTALWNLPWTLKVRLPETKRLSHVVVSSLISEEGDKIFYRNLCTYFSYFIAQYPRKLFFRFIFVQIFVCWGGERIKILAPQNSISVLATNCS